MGFGSYESLLSLLVPLALIMYVAVLVAVPILRKKLPDRHRYVSAPFGMVLPFVVSLFYISIIVAWIFFEPNALFLFQKIVSFILFGIPIYILLNMYYNPDILLRTVNSVASLSRFFEWIILPSSIKKEILSLFGDVSNKDILDFGAGVGSLTLPLSKSVGSGGKVFALDLSKKSLSILKKRLDKSRINNVSLLFDEHLISRVHPSLPSVEMVFSVGNLSYIQDLKAVLGGLSDLLPENGRICFVDYTDFFWGIIPNQAWIDDFEKIESVFNEAGFSVRIRKSHGLLWNYLFIYGLKSDYDVPMI